MRRSHSAGLLAERFQRLLDDPHAPIQHFLDRNKAQRFLAQPKDYGKPWFGHLMADPQMLPTFCRLTTGWNSAAWVEAHGLEFSLDKPPDG